MLKAEYDGKDVMSDIGEAIGRRAATETDGGDKGAKAINNDAIGYQLFQMFDKVTMAVYRAVYRHDRGHLCEGLQPQ